MTPATDPRLAPPRFPLPDQRLARRRMRILTLAALALGAWYFGWLLAPQRVGSPLLYGILLAVGRHSTG